MASSMAGRVGGGNPCRSCPGLPTRTVCHPSLGREGGQVQTCRQEPFMADALHFPARLIPCWLRRPPRLR